MMTLCLDIATAPRARQVVTIMGSISGVSPTATEIANSSAFSQSPFVKPLKNSTTGTMTSMKRMSTQETALTPFSKLVLGGLTFRRWASSPSSVSSPTASTMAVALPLTTVLPRNARQAASLGCAALTAAAVFSTGSLSPVSEDWLTKRSLAAVMRTSAGTMSPAER